MSTSTSISTSPSTATKPASAPASNPSMTGVTLEEFHLFSKLPIELRCKIWQDSVVPRLVTIDSHFHNPIPAIYHTTREARAESKYEFNRSKFFKFVGGPVINYDTDILFCNEISSRVSPLQQAVFIQPVVKQVKRMALLLRSGVPSTWRLWRLLVHFLEGLGQGDENPDFYSVLDYLCPLLEELIFILRPGPLGSTTEDMYEIDESESENWAQNRINTVRRSFQEAQTRGLLTSVKLKFMRTEVWQR